MLRVATLVIGTALILSGCAQGKTENANPNPTPHDNKEGPGLFSGRSGNMLDAFRKSKEGVAALALPVNPYLWRASLDAISFMPLAEVDSTGGVLTTDWYSNPKTPNEQVKINILILGRALTPQSLKVTMFKQEKKGDNWVNTTAAESTVKKLEDAILTNARRLRVKENASR